MTTESFVLKRPGPQAWLSELAAPEEEGSDDGSDTFGEQVQWGFAIPSIFRVLASPRSGEVFPRAPRKGDPLWFSCGYWSCLLHMLMYSLGWARPDLGLWWWYQNDKPSNDPRLQLLSEIFDRDGDSIGSQRGYGRLGSMNVFTFRYMNLGWRDLEPDRTAAMDRDWVALQERGSAASGIRSPLGGGSDGLHLTMHCTGPLESGWAEPQLMYSQSGGSPFAAVVLESMVGWYRYLCIAGEYLSPHSINPVGWMYLPDRPAGSVPSDDRKKRDSGSRDRIDITVLVRESKKKRESTWSRWSRPP